MQIKERTAFLRKETQLELSNKEVALFSDSGQILMFDLTQLQRQWSNSEPNTEDNSPEVPGRALILTEVHRTVYSHGA